MHIHSSSFIDFFFLSQLFYAALLCHYECLLCTTCKAKICIAIMKALYTWGLHLFGRRAPRFRSFCVRYLMTKQSLLSFVARNKISMVLIFPSSLKIVVHLLLVLQHFRLCYNCVTCAATILQIFSSKIRSRQYVSLQLSRHSHVEQAWNISLEIHNKVVST